MNRYALLVLLGATLPVPAVSQEAPSPRAFVAGAGMGVNALRAPDLVDVASSTNGARVDAFTSAAEFFAFATVPLAGVWALGVEYAYLVGGYRVRSGFGAGEYGFRAHLPSVLLHYSLVEEPAYSVRAGGGVETMTVSVSFPGQQQTQ